MRRPSGAREAFPPDALPRSLALTHHPRGKPTDKQKSINLLPVFKKTTEASSMNVVEAPAVFVCPLLLALRMVEAPRAGELRSY